VLNSGLGIISEIMDTELSDKNDAKQKKLSIATLVYERIFT